MGVSTTFENGMKNESLCDRTLTLYGGTYLNKGGAAIAYGTLKALKELGIDYGYIIDPEPFFSYRIFHFS